MVETYRPIPQSREAASTPEWEREHVVFEQQHLGRGGQSELADRFDALSDPVKGYLSLSRNLQNPELTPEAKERLSKDREALRDHILDVDKGAELVNFVNFRDRFAYRAGNGVNGNGK